MALLLVNANGAHAHAQAVVYSTRLAALQTRSWRVAWLDRRIEVAHPAGPDGLSFLQGVSPSLVVSVLVTETHGCRAGSPPSLHARLPTSRPQGATGNLQYQATLRQSSAWHCH